MLFFFIFLSTLNPEYEKFLNFEAYYLILPEEKEVFLKLEEDYQRDLFIEEFWKRRDPFPDTYENEFKEGFLRRLEEGAQLFDFYDPRTRFYALFGSPDEIIQIKCESYVPSFIWKYKRLDVIKSPATLLFYQPLGMGRYKLYEGMGKEVLYSGERRDEICFEKIYLSAAISWTKDALLDGKLQILQSPPKVELEDVKDILKRSIFIPKGLEPLKATFSYVYKPGERGKTLLLGTLLLQDKDIKILEIKGEILKNKKFYENFNLKYYFEELPPPYPASFQISLFPGNYEIKLLAQEGTGKKGFNLVQKIEVPSLEDKTLKEKKENTFEISIPFQEIPQKGITQFQVSAPANIKKVKFFLDNIFIVQKNNYPFSIEIDLGNLPLPHTVEAIGYDSEENEVARDILFINQGIDSFKIKILSPKGNIVYYNNVFFKAEILKPEGKRVEKVEIWEGENIIMEFLTPPYEGIISIPYKPQPLLRAMAYLEDGRKAEDTVLLNSSLFEERLKVNFVNLYLSALTSTGKPVRGLKKEDFEIFEDNIRQEIIDFKEAGDLPLNLLILLDTSASMEPYFEDIKKAIIYFSEKYLKEGDKVSIITFSSTQKILLPLSSERKNISDHLKNLKAEGNTNLYDAFVFSLYQFQNKKERNAILLLTDGKDTGSSFSFEDCLDYIKHSQVIVYPVAINIKFTDIKIRKVLSEISDISGGTFFSISSDEIDYTYKRILEELRSQYLLSYISSQTGENFRRVEVKTKENLILKTISGYFP